ncbi:MAG: hypothetical protein FWF01_00825 [Alphaproteobacteria bacterium]|nr:hypothetical protein [Alphaproteobacteria bacterium]
MTDKFNRRDLSVLGFANGFTLWHYRTGLSSKRLEEKGFFDGIARSLRSGDIIMVSSASTAGQLLVRHASPKDGVRVTKITARSF